MKEFILITLILFMINPVFAGAESQEEAPVIFKDQDLERYKKSSDKSYKALKDTESTNNPLDENYTSSIVKKTKQRLKQYNIPYTAYEGTARRVIIPVTLNGSVTAPLALDTGSPGMIISDRLADKLGLLGKDNGKLITFAAGIGGSVPAILTVVDTVEVEGVKDQFVPTIITQSLSEAFEGLIGMDFMANYSIKIDTMRHVVVFEELPPRPNMPAGHDEMWWKTYFRRFASMRAEWREYRENLKGLNMQMGDPQKLRALREFADQQYREADKLFNKLNSYAISHAVPMAWREY